METQLNSLVEVAVRVLTVLTEKDGPGDLTIQVLV